MKDKAKAQQQAMEQLGSEWSKEDLLNVLRAISETPDWNGTKNDFMSHCTACGGNWAGMLLTGIRDLFPAVYDAIPENLGTDDGVTPFINVIAVLKLCGVWFDE